jgi:hypothetical protein
MSRIVILENDQVSIWYHPHAGIIHHQMHEYAHGEVFRSSLLAGADAMKKYRAHKWLSDDRNNPVLKPDDLQWAFDTWEPKVLALGWKCWAVVQPEHVVAKIRMSKLVERYLEKGVTAQLFSDPNAAMKWLVSQ